MELTVGAIESGKFEATLELSPKGIDEEGTVKFEVRAAVKSTEDIFLRAGYSANADIILDRRMQVVSIKERCASKKTPPTWKLKPAIGNLKSA